MAKSQYEEEEEYSEAVEEKPKSKRRTDCPSRIDELAKPKRWLLLGTFRDFGYRFEPERMQALKEKVQELFSMSPEETELYFNSMRDKKPRRLDIKALRRKIRREKAEAKKEAYKIFQKLIKKAMRYAYKHAPPLLVTPMLRIISDHVLEILSDLHKIELPKRTDNDKLGQFLVSIADWTAIFVANIYYEIEVEDRQEKLRAMTAAGSETEEEEEEEEQEEEDEEEKNEEKKEEKKKKDESKAESDGDNFEDAEEDAEMLKEGDEGG